MLESQNPDFILPLNGTHYSESVMSDSSGEEDQFDQDVTREKAAKLTIVGEDSALL